MTLYPLRTPFRRLFYKLASSILAAYLLTFFTVQAADLLLRRHKLYDIIQSGKEQ